MLPKGVIPELDARESAKAQGLGCMRGLRYALMIEAAAGLAFYALWLFWHIVR